MDSITRPWQQDAFPESLAIPGMLSREERQYLAWVTRETHRGDGAVVDLGPWVGCSTACLAEGLRRRGSDAAVHAYDLFEWSPHYMERSDPRLQGVPPGADFQHLFAEFTRPWADLIRAEKMNLKKPHWDGGPIEILFVDAAKDWELTRAILRCFAPHLLPGRSRVILQDFRHLHTVWLPLVFDSEPTTWKEMESVLVGDTVTMTPLRQLEPDDLALGKQLSNFTYADADKIWSTRRESAETAALRQRYTIGWCRVAALFGEVAVVDRIRAELVDDLGAKEAQKQVTRISTMCRHDLCQEFNQAMAVGDRERATGYLKSLLHWWPELEATQKCMRQFEAAV